MNRINTLETEISMKSSNGSSSYSFEI